MSVFICNKSKLLEQITLLNTEINHFANKANTFSTLGGTSYLKTCLTKLTNNYKKCSSNVKKVQDYMKKYYDDLDIFDRIGACSSKQTLSEAPGNIGSILRGTTIADSPYHFTWEFPYDSVGFKATKIAGSSSNYSVTNTSEVKWKVIKAHAALTVLCFSSMVIDTAEEIFDLAFSIAGNVAALFDNDEVMQWCKEAIMVDLSEEMYHDAIQDYKDIGYDIARYADPDGTYAQVVKLVSSIGIGIMINTYLGELGGVKAVFANALYDAGSAYGASMEMELNNGASWSEANILSTLSGIINGIAGSVRGKVTSELTTESTLTTRKILFKSSGAASISALQPLAVKTLDTLVYENDGKINSISELIKQLYTNMENDGTVNQMLISGASTLGSTIYSGFKSKMYSNDYKKTGVLNKKDNYLKYTDEILDDADAFFKKNQDYFDINKINKDQYVESIIPLFSKNLVSPTETIEYKDIDETLESNESALFKKKSPTINPYIQPLPVEESKKTLNVINHAQTILSLPLSERLQQVENYKKTGDVVNSFFFKDDMKEWMNKAAPNVKKAYGQCLGYIYQVDQTRYYTEETYRMKVNQDVNYLYNVLKNECNKYQKSLPITNKRTINFYDSDKVIDVELVGYSNTTSATNYANLLKMIGQMSADDQSDLRFIKKIIINNESNQGNYAAHILYNGGDPVKEFYSGGTAFYKDGTLVLHPESFDNNLKWYINHEVGHFFDYNFLEPNGIKISSTKEWQEAVLNDAKEKNKTATTDYGALSTEEDFADSCALYKEDPNEFRKNFPNRYKVIDKMYKIAHSKQ